MKLFAKDDSLLDLFGIKVNTVRYEDMKELFTDPTYLEKGDYFSVPFEKALPFVNVISIG